MAKINICSNLNITKFALTIKLAKFFVSAKELVMPNNLFPKKIIKQKYQQNFWPCLAFFVYFYLNTQKDFVFYLALGFLYITKKLFL